VSVARGASGAGVVACGGASLLGFDFRGLEALGDVKGEMVYFEVILVWGMVRVDEVGGMEAETYG
jgi:hypothetical protein